MGNNQEIRQRMETYRTILLVINWIGSIIGIIIGFIAINKIEGYAAIIIIAAILFGIIGHFIINVGLAIPFILLNNGDILESLKGKTGSPISTDLSNTSGRLFVGNKLQKRCARCKREVDEDYSSCPHCGNNTFE
jgi:hypothetical protein